MASKKPLLAARKPLPTTKKPSQEITAGSAGADIAKQKYDILLADMQRRAQLGQFDQPIDQGGYIGSPENLTPIYGQQGPMGGMVSANDAGIPIEQRKILNELMIKMRADIAARDIEQKRMMNEGKFTIGGGMAGPIYGSMAGPIYANGMPVNPTSSQMAQQPIPIQMPIMQQDKQPPTFGKANQQAMQNYQNLLKQGLANYQAQTYTRQGQFGSTAIPAQTSPQRKPSTPGFPTPKPFG